MVLMELLIKFMVILKGVSKAFSISRTRSFATNIGTASLAILGEGSDFSPGVSFSGVKRLGREADHSPPSSVKVKNASSWRGA
jgi:hypothetical protein